MLAWTSFALLASVAHADEHYTLTFVDLTTAEEDPVRDRVFLSFGNCGRPSAYTIINPFQHDAPPPRTEECSVLLTPLSMVGAGGSVELVRAAARGDRNAAGFVTPGRTDAIVVYDRTANGRVVVTVLSGHGVRVSRVQRPANRLDERECNRIALAALRAIRRRARIELISRSGQHAWP